MSGCYDEAAGSIWKQPQFAFYKSEMLRLSLPEVRVARTSLWRTLVSFPAADVFCSVSCGRLALMVEIPLGGRVRRGHVEEKDTL